MSQKDQMRKIVNYIKSSCMIFCAKVTRYSKMFLNYIKSSRVILYGKMFPYFYTTDAHFSVKIVSISFSLLWTCKNSSIF